MNLDDYIYDECHRQHVTNYGNFAAAMNYSDEYGVKQDNARKFSGFVQMIAFVVDPEVNNFVVRTGTQAGMDNLRTSHVGFMHGGSAAPTGEVRERFDRWCEYAFDLATMKDLLGRDDAIESCIKSLLDIHPWADGNGRTASILRNWMLGTLDDPEPLPYYYGGS